MEDEGQRGGGAIAHRAWSSRWALFSSVLALFAVAPIAACGDDDDDSRDGAGETAATQPAEGDGTGEVSELFALSAEKGTLQPTGAADEFALTLQDLNSHVTVFTDRPERQAGTETAAAFVGAWANRGFEQTPPNAALELVHGQDSHDTKVFELSNPRYDAKADTLSFSARELGDSASTALSGFAEGSDEQLPSSFREASLFIDSASPQPSVRLALSLAGAKRSLAPKGAQAVVTFDTQSVVSSAFGSAFGIGSGSADGSTVKMRCEASNTCVVSGSLGLTPVQTPITGSLTVTEGAFVYHASEEGGFIAIPPGPFSVPAETPPGG